MLLSIAALVIGYLLYGRFVEKVFGADASRPTPAHTMTDGVDYVIMPSWKVFMIQFLNIAGTGPIFGAILGAMYGPSCYLWIVFGCIFGGAVHDYFSGMLSVRNGGKGLPDLVGKYLGSGTQKVMLCFACLLLLLVAAVFVYSPALILGDLTGGGAKNSVLLWVGIIILYYLVATMVPIDKLIGKIYSLFAFALIFMALALLICLFVKWPAHIPEVWDGLQNRNPSAGRIFPCLFITIACGAVSGFHATQSPLMARCIGNEKLGRPIFYGSMITEGIIALIWATVSSWFFYGGGNAEMGATGVVAAPSVVTNVSRYWLGTLGSVLAMLGVVAAPITSGDTALRSARLIVADALHLDQKPIRNRLGISVILFAITAALLVYNISDAQGFNVIWGYFGWANQTLSIFTFWAITAFLVHLRPGKPYYLISLLPACFMTAVCVAFILTAKIGFRIPQAYAPAIGAVTFALSACIFFWLKNRSSK